VNRRRGEESDFDSQQKKKKKKKGGWVITLQRRKNKIILCVHGRSWNSDANDCHIPMQLDPHVFSSTSIIIYYNQKVI
jgi:hypothetical protein